MTTQTITCLQVAVPTFQKHAVSLDAILDEFEGNADAFSQKLLDWGDTTLLGTGQDQPSSVEEQRKWVEGRIRLLVEKILVDPLSGTLLEEPVTAREWVVSLKTYNMCKGLFKGISPLDKQPMQEHPPLHLFGHRMVLWVKNLITVPPSSLSEDPEFYIQKAALAVFVRQQEQLRARMQAMTLAMGAARKLQTAAASEAFAMAKAQAVTNESSLEQGLDALHQAYKGRIQSLAEQHQALEHIYRTNVTQLEQRITVMQQSNAAAVTTLREELNVIHTAHQRTVASLTQQMGMLTKEQKEKEACMRAHIAKKQQEIQLEIEARQAGNLLTMQAMELQLTEKSEQVSQLHGYVGQLQSRVAEQDGNIVSLQGTVNVQEEHIRKLKKKLSRALIIF